MRTPEYRKGRRVGGHRRGWTVRMNGVPALAQHSSIPPFHHSTPFARRAFTIVEATISTIVVAVMLVAALNTVGASRMTQHRAALVSRAQLLAEALLAEVLQQRYEEPEGTPAFGREAGELATTRAAWDDVDDYDGWSASPPTEKDGTVLANATGWKRTVTVARIDPQDPGQARATETGAKRITVTASYHDVPQAVVVAIRTVDWE